MKLLLIASLALSFNAFATTAVLCGDPESVDRDENTASLHLIFEHPENEIIEDLRVSYFGREASGLSVKSNENGYIIKTKSPKKIIEINRSDVSYCESEDLFRVIINSKIINDCRCFEG